MTEPIDQGEYWLAPCEKYRAGEPHAVHQIHEAACEHEHNAWCWGTPEPGSVREQVEQLQPGQRVLVVLEGVVEAPRNFPSYEGRRRPVTMRGGGETFVLRYLGDHPATAGTLHRHRDVNGKVNSTVVSVKVLPPVDP